MSRIIGIIHRVKKTAKNEARPTMVCIAGKKNVIVRLQDEQAELDFILGCFPTKWRKARVRENLSRFKPHHVRKNDDGVVEVPDAYDGVKEGDHIAFLLGGSGDRMAAATFRQSQKVGAMVFRLPAYIMKMRRDEKNDKSSDHELLAHLLATMPQHFYVMTLRDRKLIRLREAYFRRNDTMKARIACEQRLRQRFIGGIYLSEEGGFPEGSIEDEFDKLKASDTILVNVTREQKQAEREMQKAIEQLPVWQLFESVDGCGVRIAAGIISAVCDVRRFERASQLRKFCGVHVNADGTFPRRRAGQMSNWHPDARQSLFLLGDQCFKRPKTKWGKILRQNMRYYKKRHPRVMWEHIFELDGEKLTFFTRKGKQVPDRKIPEGAVKKGRPLTRYNPMHIRRMAIWRTLSQFVDWLHGEWWKLELANQEHSIPSQVA